MELLIISKMLEKTKLFLKKTYQENLDQVILFGSRARGDHNSDSDLDIAVTLFVR